MFDWQTEIAKQRQQEMLASTRSYRLVKEALEGACKRFSLSDRTLSWLGSSLVSLGHRLQSRSGIDYAPTGNLIFLAGHERPRDGQRSGDSLSKIA